MANVCYSYIAYEDTATNLHFDMSDAVNLLVHIGPAPPSPPAEVIVSIDSLGEQLESTILEPPNEHVPTTDATPPKKARGSPPFDKIKYILQYYGS